MEIEATIHHGGRERSILITTTESVTNFDSVLREFEHQARRAFDSLRSAA